MSQVSIFSEIAAERIQQDAKYGGAEHDDEHSASEWAELIIDKADDISLTSEQAEVRKRFVQAAALAVAAIEACDRGAAPL